MPSLPSAASGSSLYGLGSMGSGNLNSLSEALAPGGGRASLLCAVLQSGSLPGAGHPVLQCSLKRYSRCRFPCKALMGGAVTSSRLCAGGGFGMQGNSPGGALGGQMGGPLDATWPFGYGAVGLPSAGICVWQHCTIAENSAAACRAVQ